jgi:hypothetical protein
MINDIIILDDVIPLQYQDAIEDFLLGEVTVPWYLVNDVTYIGTTNEEANIDKKYPGLSHLFKNEEGHLDPFYDFFRPLAFTGCEKINFKINEIIRVRAFLQLPTYYPPRENNPHVDLRFSHLVCLYYVNDSQGPTNIYEQTFNELSTENVGSTEFILKQQVDPKKGRCVFFNGLHYHSSSSPNHSKRCVVNFDII